MLLYNSGVGKIWMNNEGNILRTIKGFEVNNIFHLMEENYAGLF
jgi:hypothetical protein